MNNITAETITEGVKYLNELYLELATKVMLVLAILLIGFIIGRLLGKLTQKTMQRVGLNNFADKIGIGFSLELFFGNAVAYLVYFTTVLISLNKLGLTTTILHIIATGMIVFIILLTAISLRDILPNVIAGFTIKQKGIIKIGDNITIQGKTGKIKKINLTEILLETKKEEVYIPNSILIKEEIIKKKPEPSNIF